MEGGGGGGMCVCVRLCVRACVHRRKHMVLVLALHGAGAAGGRCMGTRVTLWSGGRFGGWQGFGCLTGAAYPGVLKPEA